MTLPELVDLHRGMYRDDLAISQLVQRHPPTTMDPQTGVLHEEPAAAIGMTLSSRLLRYCGHPEGYGSDFPWSKALWRLRYRCRKDHPHHRAANRPYWRGSLCHQLAVFVVVQGFSVENAGRILKLDEPEPVLRSALQWMEGSMDRARDAAERRAA